MKKIGILVVLLLLLFAVKAQKKNYIKIHPMGAILGNIPLSYERFIKQKVSLTINANFLHSISSGGKNEYINRGYGIGPELRYYFRTDSLLKSKRFGGAFFCYNSYENSTLDKNNELVSGQTIGNSTGIIVGSSWVLKTGFTVDFFIGPAYNYWHYNKNYESNSARGGLIANLFDVKTSGTSIRIGFSLGFKF